MNTKESLETILNIEKEVERLLESSNLEDADDLGEILFKVRRRKSSYLTKAFSEGILKF